MASKVSVTVRVVAAVVATLALVALLAGGGLLLYQAGYAQGAASSASADGTTTHGWPLPVRGGLPALLVGAALLFLLLFVISRVARLVLWGTVLSCAPRAMYGPMWARRAARWGRRHPHWYRHGPFPGWAGWHEWWGDEADESGEEPAEDPAAS
jgi:hypothetical protein